MVVLKRAISEPSPLAVPLVYDFTEAAHPGYTRDHPVLPSGQLYTEDTAEIYLEGRFKIMVIGDGHGGTHMISEYVTRRVGELMRLKFSRTYSVNIKQYLLRVFAFIQNEVAYSMCNKSKLPAFGGSTCTACIIDQYYNVAYFATLGDSPAWVLRRAPKSGHFTVAFRNYDGSASNVLEQERILRVDPTAMTDKRLGKDECGVWRYDAYMPSASFGDLSAGIGYGRVPVIESFELEPADIVVVSSDGLQQCITMSPSGQPFLGPENQNINNKRIARWVQTAVDKGESNLAAFLIKQQHLLLTTQAKTYGCNVDGAALSDNVHVVTFVVPQKNKTNTSN